MTMVATTAFGGAMADDYFTFERIIGRFRVGKKRIIRVRAKHAESIALGFDRGDEATLGVQHDRGWYAFDGQRAMHATTVLLASTNQRGGDPRTVQSAVDQIERAGNSARYLTTASRRNGWRGGRPVSVLNRIRGIGAMHLDVTERLALEMAVHEEIERRAAEGELAELQAAWAEAEEIATIVDNMLTPFNSTSL
jgi:hypothetical protein